MTTKKIITLAMLAVTMASCSQKQQEEETTAIITSTTEKNDTVMKEFVKENLYWTREPKQYVITDSLITIETEPNTDLWQRTYYGFSNDNAPVLQMKTSCQYFSFTVKTEFNSSALFDQCGIAIYLDSDNWMKASIEYENEDYQRLGSVVTNNGYSGSLLGVQYQRIASISVGYKTDYQMYSMDFEEFLWAKGYSEEAISDMLCHMLEGVAFSEAEQMIFSTLFLEYCILGGMPAIVSSYIERETFEGSLDLQHQLLVDYENDIVKYAQGLDKAKILSVYRSIPAQLAKENKKFQYSKVSKGGRSKDYMGCVEWLKDAGLINVCECLQFPELPLKGNVDESKYKVYISDTGLLVASLDDESQIDLRANKNLGIYKGALYENFAAEALVKQGYGLYYYSKDNSTLEEDFFIRSANELIPVEVKANTNRAKSMRQLIKSDTYTDIKHGIKLMAGNVGISENIVTFPYFCTFLLKRYMGKQNLFQ